MKLSVDLTCTIGPPLSCMKKNKTWSSCLGVIQQPLAPQRFMFDVSGSLTCSLPFEDVIFKVSTKVFKEILYYLPFWGFLFVAYSP